MDDPRAEWRKLYHHLTPEERLQLYTQAKRRLFITRHNHKIILIIASIFSIAYNPTAALFLLPTAWVGLRYRARLNLPVLRLLTAVVFSLAISACITLQIAPTQPPAALVLISLFAALFTATGLTAAYLLRSAFLTHSYP